eukprot:GHVU01066326.1.p1 GENE.GHVU01066326.1~~GHVU01066326.1.p1  ORF type:complete len:452 (+),score=49.92 GHVU01066326.1:1631-2986(+)
MLCADGAGTIGYPILRVKYPEIFMIRCAAHLEDLKLHDLGNIPTFGGILSRARTSSQFLLNHSNLLRELGKHAEKRPVKYCKTRFAIQVLTADRLAEIRPACEALVVSAEWDRWLKTQKPKAKRRALAFKRRMQRGRFWDSIELALDVFVPVLRLLREADSERAGYAGRYMVRQTEVEAEVVAALRHFTPAVQSAAMGSLRKRRKEGHNCLFSVAFALDPTWVGRDANGLLGEEWARVARREWLDFVETLPDADRPAILKGKADFDLSIGTFAHSVAVESRSGPSALPPHVWWHTFGGDHPALQRLACRVLSVPIAASACERNWSLYSFVMSRRRLCMGADTARKLVIVLSNRIALDNIRNPRKQHDRDPWEPPHEDDAPDTCVVAERAGIATVVHDDDSVGRDDRDDIALTDDDAPLIDDDAPLIDDDAPLIDDDEDIDREEDTNREGVH